MKAPSIALLSMIIASALPTALGESSLQPLPDLKSASEYPAAKIKEIQAVAYREWPHLLAEEAPKVAGTFRTVRPIKGFSEKGDLIWEVRMIHLVQTPTGILWINDKTKASIGLGLNK